MPFQWVFLWTDLLVYALLLAVIGFAAYAARHEHLRAPWRQVVRRPLAVSASVVLLVYVAIGLLDSIHFRERLHGDSAQYSTQVWSVLDKATLALRTRTERTYSAPFATHAFQKETVEHAGARTREYPRLRHGGAHLQNPEDRAADIAWRTVFAATVAALVWLAAVAGLAALWHAPGERFVVVWRRLWRGETDVPWRSILVTIGALMILGASAGYLSLHYHIFGTDQVGQDVFLRSLKGVRTGLVIGTVTTLVMLPFALVLGVMAGYFRGWIDDAIQYLYTTLSSIPGVLLIAAAILSLQVYMANHPEQFTSLVERADFRLLWLCVILGITSWTGLCRLLRGEALKLREIDYVDAARALGVSSARIMTRHLFPNVMHIVLIAVVLDFSGLVLAEAVLSYVGVGVDPTMDSWGNMINTARLEMAREPMVWWSLAAAFLFMFALVLAANLFADAVRDAFDPRLRR